MKFTCGIKEDKAYCWGNNDYKQLGKSIEEKTIHTPQEIEITP